MPLHSVHVYAPYLEMTAKEEELHQLTSSTSRADTLEQRLVNVESGLTKAQRDIQALEAEVSMRKYWVNAFHKSEVFLQVDVTGSRFQEFPDVVTFNTLDPMTMNVIKPSIQYSINGGTEDDHPIALLNSAVSELDPEWDKIGPDPDYHMFDAAKKYLEESGYTRTALGARHGNWAPTFNVSTKDDKFCNLLCVALLSNFRDGELNRFLYKVCNKFKKMSGDQWLTVIKPAAVDCLVSRVTIGSGTTPWHDAIIDVLGSPVSLRNNGSLSNHSHSSVGSSLNSPTGSTVPNLMVYHASLPRFLLNIECKSSNDLVGYSSVQCLSQCLTHMHHQDLHFGLVINPMKWRVMVVIKNNTEKSITVLQHTEQLYTTNEKIKGIPPTLSLNVPSFIAMFNIIGKIIVFEHSRILKEIKSVTSAV